MWHPCDVSCDPGTIVEYFVVGVYTNLVEFCCVACDATIWLQRESYVYFWFYAIKYGTIDVGLFTFCFLLTLHVRRRRRMHSLLFREATGDRLIGGFSLSFPRKCLDVTFDEAMAASCQILPESLFSFHLTYKH